jgi:glycosyltransferase involved in cell wall biosynthesis
MDGLSAMERLPLVSVIIPAYNHEKYVRETIASIIEQTYKNIELIIIDDGSKDSTWQKILEMQDVCKDRFTRVDFSTQENSGTCITLNRLIEKTQGEYVYIIASDDKAAPEAVEKEYAFLAENPDYALAVGSNDIIDSDGKRCFWDKNMSNVYNEEDAKWLSFSDAMMKFGDQLDFFSDDFGTYRSLLHFENHIPNGYLIRKSIFNKIEKFTPDAPLEDYFLMFQISKYAKMKYLPDTLFYYRWHGANATIKKDMVYMSIRTQLHEIKNACPRIYDYISGLQAQNTDTQSRLTDTQSRLTDTQTRLTDTQSRLEQTQEQYNLLKQSRTFRTGKIILFIPRTIKVFLKKIMCFLKNNIEYLSPLYVVFVFVRNSFNFGLRPAWYLTRLQLQEEKKGIFAQILRPRSRGIKQNIKISILTLIGNTDIKYLREMIESIKDQTYSNWELYLLDISDLEHSGTGNICPWHKDKDDRIKYFKMSGESKKIFIIPDEILQMMTGDYVALLDPSDVLFPDALYENIIAIHEIVPDILYSDEDHLDKNGLHHSPFFKPDWSPDTLYCQNYIYGFIVIKTELINYISKLNHGLDFFQCYKIILSLFELTDSFFHISKILYSRRDNETYINSGAKDCVQHSELAVLNNHLKRKLIDFKAVASETKMPHVSDVRYSTLENEPLVSIIIPIKDGWQMTDACIKSIVEKSSYKNIEILILDNDSVNSDTIKWLAEAPLIYNRLKILKASFDFNWSKLNNYGIKHSKGDVYIFLNNDTLVISEDWIERLCENALRSRVGAVGPLLLYEDDTIQHAGVVVGLGGWADHVFRHQEPQCNIDLYLSPAVTRNVLAVTGACMCVSKQIMEEIGLFNENFIICGSDIEFCIRAHEAGKYNIYNAFVKMYHLESKSRDGYIPPIDYKLSWKYYKPYLLNVDPFFNSNLDINSTNPKVTREKNKNLKPFLNYLIRRKFVHNFLNKKYISKF